MPNSVSNNTEHSEGVLVNTDWSQEELLASVQTYLHMQQLERAGTPCVKKHQYAVLAQRFGRTAKSYDDAPHFQQQGALESKLNLPDFSTSDSA